MSGETLEDFSHYIPLGDLGRFAQNLSENIDTNFAETINTLKDKGFQNLLVNYQRKQKPFFVAYEAQDKVTSSYVFRSADGSEIKPEDYITAFEKFVKKNPDKIEAIRILLSKPKDWDTSALFELRTKLAKTQYKFTEDRLRKAYHNELADIISIVKHAAKNEPLISTQERVKRALQHLTKGKKFTSEQARWLELIKEHLMINLAIDEKDLKTIPVFAREGGLKQADRAFDGKLLALLKKVNLEMAK